jgi:hypothetical protein
MPSSVYQNMVNLIAGFPIWGRPSIFMDVAMWEHRKILIFHAVFCGCVTRFVTLRDEHRMKKVFETGPLGKIFGPNRLKC